MRQVLTVSAIACILAVASFTLLPGQQAKEGQESVYRPGPTWEYQLVPFADLIDGAEGDAAEIEAVQTRFNELGREGWELSENLFRAVVFKRAKN